MADYGTDWAHLFDWTPPMARNARALRVRTHTRLVPDGGKVTCTAIMYVPLLRFRLRIVKYAAWCYEVLDLGQPKGWQVVRSGASPQWADALAMGLHDRNEAEQEWAWGKRL
jgi:hypothetical protein